MLQAAASDAADQFGRMADLLGKIGLASLSSPRRGSNDPDQHVMLAIVNGLAADRILQSNLEIVLIKADEARAAVALRIVEVVSRFWR